MKKLLLLLTLTVFTFQILSAQKFLRPFDSVSKKKTSFLIKENGDEMECNIKKLKRKKGLIREFNYKSEKGKKITLPIEQIKYAYLPQTNFGKFVKSYSFLYDATQWEDGMYDKDRFKEGYALFEKSEVIVKKKQRTLLMQLLNPSACSKLKVYHDPFANETMGVGVAGIKLAGGDDKSYYVKFGDKPAFKLSKKKYKKRFEELFGDCSAAKSIGNSWSDFEAVVFAYNQECK